MPTDPRLAAFQAEADKVIAHLKGEFAKLQTGRANPALVEHIDVEAYGQRQQLRALAGVTVQDARTIAVQPWDRSILQNIEKAIQMANTGGGIVNDGILIRISLPVMNQEGRERMAKVVQKLGEEARVALRKHRQDWHAKIKEEKDEDVRDTLQQQLQKAVDDANAKIADGVKKKEEELMKL